MREEKLYRPKEISIATGLKVGAINYRRVKRGIQKNKAGYTLEQVKNIVKRMPRQQYSKRKAEELRQILKNDGAI